MPVLILERLPMPSLKTYLIFSMIMLFSALFYSYQIVRNMPASQSLPLPKNYSYENGEPPDVKQQTRFTSNLGLDNTTTLPVKNTSSGSYEHSTSASSRLENAYGVFQVSKPSQRFHTLVHEESEEAITKTDGQMTMMNRTLPYDNVVLNVLYVITAEVWGVWALVNTAYCCLIFCGKLIQLSVFGNLRVIEQQHLRDRFWNFVFYKFIFIFGVMNVQTMEEVIMWVAWFSTLGFYNLLSQLCKDRFEYVSSSPSTVSWIHVKTLSLLMFILTSITALTVLSGMVGYHAGYSIFTFLAAECLLLGLKTMYVVGRYIIHLWDMSLEGTWENRSVYVYYTELVFELTTLIIDFAHHLHMLLWGNIFLSMASLVICMHLRYLFYEFQRRFRRHKNYLNVLRNVESRFAMASASELDHNSDNCAICWEKMEAARKLPCSHLFHNSCLRSWLEQDTSCPTCRVSLSQGSHPAAGDNGTTLPHTPLSGHTVLPPPARRRRHLPFTNHFFHFDASRYVSWLPSFSVEVTHTNLLHTSSQNHLPVQSSHLDTMAHQVLAIFPHAPLNAVLEDLQTTQSVDQTIDNILEGRVPSQSQQLSDESNDDLALMQTPENFSDAVEEIHEQSSEQLTTSNTSGTISDTVGEDPVSSSGSRFSKSSRERETMLRQRKAAMMETARRRFLATSMETQRSDV